MAQSTDGDRPTILNPEAVGDARQSPILRLPDAFAAYFERTRCPRCGYINNHHDDDCPSGAR